MEQESRLYKVIYQSVLTQIYSGVLRYGQVFPSQSELCQRYQVGITTIRKVIRMLEQEGVIHTSSGKRAVVCFDESEQTYILSLMQRRESILDIYKGLELMMPSLYAAGAMHCRNLDIYAESAFSAGSQDINERNIILFLRKCFCPIKIRLCWIFNPIWSTMHDFLMLCSPGWKTPSPHRRNSSDIITRSSWTWQNIRNLKP